ncbi:MULTISPECIES: helix-turn-helix domain-containing protein [Providencia]|uniref:Helix-turn-helix domain-containing protein n=1 Tax=Providencia manganoxydans TaxID=2923283 RepID=A0ABX7AF67_9GAMM|nr:MULTISPECIES: helix-turn-helix domain-containing protein [Providencia]MDX4947423.1 helix-turn-helix domain-containing protein [Providencia manganoxydans]QQO62591.1 helix-turn-helix domain-containing protein [Providencia manganoxydans]HEF8773885.1 helix-turn-helix domain-containing protein [Providencia stuartii]
MKDTNINALLEAKGCNLSLQDNLVLAVPNVNADILRFNSSSTECVIEITEKSLFICSLPELDFVDNKTWSIYAIALSEVVEILAVIDTAMGQSFLSKNEELELPNHKIIKISGSLSPDLPIKNLVIDLIIQQQSQFNTWCNILRRYEAYGIMRFLLSAAEKDKNANINDLCKKYGVSASYFRQLYRENFNKTAKRKIMSVRMASAILKLIESDDSILDVGLEAGYCSASHFTNDIKNELGLTPSDIRHLGVKLYEK